MAPRAHWKGYLRLSLVQSPVVLYPAVIESEKIRFHQLNRKTGHRIRYLKVDAVTGEPVDADDIVLGYEIAKGSYIPIGKDELEAIALESKHVIEIDEFVPKAEIDELYHLRPYYLAPDGQAGLDAFAVIRDTIGRLGWVGIGRVVLTNREHVIALEPRGQGMLGMLLRYPYEIRKAEDYFDAIPDVKLPKDMFELAEHIVRMRAGHFHPEKFEDRFETALRELIHKKQKGEPIAPARPARPPNVVNLMDALRRSVEADGTHARRAPAQRQSVRRRGAKRAGAHARKAG